MAPAVDSFHLPVDDGETSQAGVTVKVDGGRPVSCTSLGRGEDGSVARGGGSDWLAALSGGDEGTITFDGDSCLRPVPDRGPARVCAKGRPSDDLVAA